MPEKNKQTKQILLRITPSLYEKIVRMAEDDFRSVNGEIEYLLTLAAERSKRGDTRGGVNKIENEK